MKRPWWKFQVLQGGLLGLVLLLGYSLPFLSALVFEDNAYFLQVMVWVCFFAYASSSWNLIGGFAGQYSIGHAGFLGLGAYISSLLLIEAGLTPWIGMLIGGLVALLVSLVIGYPCFRLRGVFFTLVTIAFAEMLRVSVELTDTVWGIQINGVRGLLLPISGHAPLEYQFIEKQYYYWVILTLLVLVIFVAWGLKRSALGYYLTAIRDEEDAVRMLGINVTRTKLIALALSAFFTALAGTFYAQFILFITPTRVMGLDLSIQMLIMAIVGGMGTVMGPVYGAMILVPMSELTRAYWGGSYQGVHLILHGALLIITILFLPQGIEQAVTSRIRQGVRTVGQWLLGAEGVPTAQEGVTWEVGSRMRIPEGKLFPYSQAQSRQKEAAQPLLQVVRISRHFGGVEAVKNVSFTVEAGEIVGLIGPNGAGKTTVFNLITGYFPLHSGQILLEGEDISRLPTHEINQRGIARTFQILRPFPTMTTLENVLVALLPRICSQQEAAEEAFRYLEFVGLAHRSHVVAGGLSSGQRKRLELARAMATRPRMLLLDEVTGGMDQRSLPGFIELIQKIRGEGITLLVIEHNLRVITTISDRILVMHLGEKIAEGRPEEVVRNQQVIDAYIGEYSA